MWGFFIYNNNNKWLAFKSIQTCKHNYIIYTMQINNNNKLLKDNTIHYNS